MARRISSPVLIDRDAELRAFDLALEEAAERRPSLFVIGGEAGIGKSRLVSEFASRVRAGGGVAALGAALPPAGGQRVPLAAVTQVLRALVRSIDVRLLDHVLGPSRGDLAALLPELGPPSTTTISPPFAAARLAEAVLVAIEAVAMRQRLLLVALEDLHWLDDATAATLVYVARNLVDAPVILVLTYRSDHPREPGGVLDAIAEIDRARTVERLELAPLGAADIDAQVRAIAGVDAPAARVHEIVRRSGGIPFYVEELILAGAEVDARRPPPSVRAATTERLSRLSAGARSLTEALAVAGRSMPSDLVGEAAAVPRGALVPAVMEATASHLVVPVPGSAGVGTDQLDELDIRHILIREAIVGALPGLRRRELHGRLAAAIERRPIAGSGDDVERTSTLARHWLLAGEEGRALPMLLREAASAEQAHAFSTAAQAYRLALDAWARVGAGEATTGRIIGPLGRAEVLERAAHASSLAGRPADAVAFIRAALDAEPAPTQATDLERQPRLTMHLGRFLAETGQPQEAVAALDASCTSADAGPLLRARALTSLSRLLLSLGRAPEAVDRAGQAVGMLEGLPVRSTGRVLAQARTALATALAGVGRMGEATAALEAGARAAGNAGRRPRTSRSSTSSRPSRIVADLQSYLDRAIVLEGSGDLVAAAQAAEEGLRLAQSRGLAATHGAVLAATAAWDRLRVGAWDAADELLEGLDPDAGTPAEVRLVRGRLAGLRGQWQRAESDLAGLGPGDSTVLQRGWVAVPSLVAVEMAYWRRRWLDARASVRRGVESAVSAGEHESLMVLALFGLRVEADAVDAGARRRLAGGSAARELAAEYWIRIRAGAGGRSAASPPRQQAIVASAEAESTRLGVATAGARAARSGVAAWETAVRAWDEAGDPYEAAYCRWRLAEAHVVGRGDREAARDLLVTAVATAGRLAAEPLAREVEAFARRARLVPTDRSQLDGLPERESAGESHARALGLSRRETEVLRLIAEGLSDRDIGERLFITTKTAGHHVSHILAKLGLDRRGEAAALAFRIGLVDQPD